MSPTTISDRTAAMDPITLAELDGRAALLDRQETKYVVPVPRLDEVLVTMAEEFDVLTIDGLRSFTYDTVYFDTDDLAAYHQHAFGRRRRLKVRSRCYVDSGLTYFEVKTKGSRDRTVKRRMRYDRELHGSMNVEAWMFLRRCIDRAGGSTGRLPTEPTLAMRFQRHTLVGKGRPERVTIDEHLRFVADDGTAVAAPHRTVIVEVKSPDGRGRTDALFRAAGIRGARCSKYCIGLNLVRDDLRGNAFRRSITTHFAPARPVLVPGAAR